MKTTMLVASAAALCVGSAQADLLVAAPGLANAVFISSSSESNSITLSLTPASDPDGTYSEYRITGVEYVLKGGIPSNGSIKNNGATLDADGDAITIDNTVSVTVKYGSDTVLTRSKTLAVNNHKDSESGSFSISSDIVANDQAVTIEVEQSFAGGDILTGDYSYLIIEGTFTENSPTPEGFIQRKASTLNQVLTAADTASMEFGASLAALDSGSSTAGGNNNGFGNNEDGIDGSNKNAIANASKWARSGKIDLAETGETMVSLLDDDEM